MKPLYWKILLILGTVIVAASLVIPKALRKNQFTDTRQTTGIIFENNQDNLKAALTPSSKFSSSLETSTSRQQNPKTLSFPQRRVSSLTSVASPKIPNINTDTSLVIHLQGYWLRKGANTLGVFKIVAHNTFDRLSTGTRPVRARVID